MSLCSFGRRKTSLWRHRLWPYERERSSGGWRRSPEHKGSNGRGGSPASDEGFRFSASVLKPVLVCIPGSPKTTLCFVSGQQRPGFCPKVPKDSPGICLHGCSGDDSCPKGMKCCSNGCGYVCKKPVFKVSTNQPRVGQGCQQHPSGLCWNRGLLTCLPHMRIRKTPRERGWRQQAASSKASSLKRSPIPGEPWWVQMRYVSMILDAQVILKIYIYLFWLHRVNYHM